MAKQVLIVDDQPGILSTLSSILEDEGYRTLGTDSGEEALRLYREERPDVVFLDIWLPDRDGLETLQALRRLDPSAAVVMISGHGTTSTAVRAIKLGASDYIEKPLSYQRVMQAVGEALRQREEPAAALEASVGDPVPERRLSPPPSLPQVREGREPQRTIRCNKVIYGLGLHSGTRTGLVLQPLPPNSGIHVQTVPAGTLIPAHVSAVGDTDYATTLDAEGEKIRTVEHLLSALHAAGITNLLLKVHGEVPVLDGSAAEFCRTLEEVGIEDQDAPRRELVVDRRYEIGSGDKSLVLEPYDGFRVSYYLRYPAPVGEQSYDFEMSDFASYKEQIAPARTFGFMRDLKMLNELGLGSGGRLDNFILVGEDNVINTELRFPDEFARHKILDIIGDLYLLGFPIRGRVSARLTGHRDNIAILRAIQAAVSA
ncbi:MAG: UDP-3-O-[3-hydroxymyristoyl] N-acetylglucosamine deacetylase [Acidobacteria bacterium]|nr:UDP-3-O-[3-hydroxymyristoyl] N-acetylglucosamine deacetylase [Acidobacteriota bacterium]